MILMYPADHDWQKLKLDLHVSKFNLKHFTNVAVMNNIIKRPDCGFAHDPD